MAIKWLNDLERKVQAASKELKTLRKENRTYKLKVKQLQRQLGETRGGKPASSAWDGERSEIRRRVAKLADGLERLL